MHVLSGEPDPEQISTSHVERQNQTIRMGMRRFTRVTNGFSRKGEDPTHILAMRQPWQDWWQQSRSRSSSPRSPPAKRRNLPIQTDPLPQDVLTGGATRVGPVETAVLIPIKSFSHAKKRLSGHLSASDRALLARWMAGRVFAAASPLPTFVACDDEQVATWAEGCGAEVLWGPGLGLNGAVDNGIETISGKGFEHVIIAHSDLPLPESLRSIAREGHVVLVPDRWSDGTNVISRPCSINVPACYGPASYRHHFDAAMMTGTPVIVRDDTNLSIDVDTIADCRHPLVAPLLEPVLSDHRWR